MSELRQNWRLLASAGTGITFSVIVLPYYTIGALVVPITEEFGWTRAEFQTAILFSAGLGALTAPLVGYLSNRFGPRRIALPAIVGLSSGFLIASTLQGDLWLLYSAYACMAILGAGTIPVTWTQAITATFNRQRGIALGLALSGTGICGVLMPQFTTYLVTEYSWRVAYIGIGLTPLLIGLPIVYWGFRSSPSVITEVQPIAETGMTLKEAARSYKFWVLLASIFVVYMAASGIGPNLYPAITDAGMSVNQAATAQSLFGAAIVAGRLLVGFAVDRYWAPGVGGVTMLLPVVGCALLIEPTTFLPTAIAAILIGLAAGAELDLMSYLASRYFGQKHYAQIYSILYMGLAICSGGAPLIFAGIYDATASYAVSFTIAMGLFALGAVVMLFMGNYPKAYEPN